MKAIQQAPTAQRALDDMKVKYGCEGSLRSTQRIRQIANGRSLEDFYGQYRDLEATLKALVRNNPGSKYVLEFERDDNDRRRFVSAFFSHGGACKAVMKGNVLTFSMDTAFMASRRIVQVLYLLVGA